MEHVLFYPDSRREALELSIKQAFFPEEIKIFDRRLEATCQKSTSFLLDGVQFDYFTILDDSRIYVKVRFPYSIGFSSLVIRKVLQQYIFVPYGMDEKEAINKKGAPLLLTLMDWDKDACISPDAVAKISNYARTLVTVLENFANGVLQGVF